jgi:predicted NACHT family NTPase
LHLVERDRISPAFFDFGLMVQTVEPPKAEQERELRQDGEKKEKIERLPVLEGICKYAADHVLLVGRPGSGKSTALARLLLQEAENALSIARAKIPVLVELRYLPSEANESSVFDRILAFMHKHDPALGIDEAGIKQLLRQGRLLLLVDGVNELPSDRGRAQVNQFRELFQKTCPMIFTTRELSAGGDLGIAKRLEMQPLTEPQMQQFVMAYLPTQGEKLLRQLSGRLREFGQTPLLLWMLCSLFQQSEQIPPNLGMVFRAFTVGYGDRIKQDVTLSKDSRAWWGRLLQYLAFKMTCGESLTELQVAISRREAEQFLVEFLRGKVEFAEDCAVRWLEDLLKHHLIQISNDRIEFRHQLIQEYYAAEWLLGLLPSLSDARLRQGYLNYLKWTEPLALMLELVDGEEQAVRVVRLALEVDLRLGARLAGAVKFGFQEKAVGLLRKEIEERKIPNLYAIELLGETRSDVAIKTVAEALESQNADIRGIAAAALGSIFSDKAVEALIQALNDQDSSVRSNAAAALVKIGSDKVVEPLINALKDQDSSKQMNTAAVLVKIGSDKAIEFLIQILENQNSNIRGITTVILGEFASGKAVEPLIQVLKDQDPHMRRRAVTALGNIGSDKAIKHLIQVLNDPDTFCANEYSISIIENWQ